MGTALARPSGPHVILLKETGGGHKCDCSEPKIDMTAPMPRLLADAGIREGDYMAMLNDVNVVLRNFSPNVKLLLGSVVCLALLAQVPHFYRSEDADVSMRVIFSVIPPMVVLILVAVYMWKVKRKAEIVRRELSKYNFRNATLEYYTPMKHAPGGVMVTIHTDKEEEGT
jgi:hypothetical protein